MRRLDFKEQHSTEWACADCSLPGPSVIRADPRHSPCVLRRRVREAARLNVVCLRAGSGVEDLLRFFCVQAQHRVVEGSACSVLCFCRRAVLSARRAPLASSAASPPGSGLSLVL